jgi:Flp pilus assembly protein TadG
MRLNRNRRERLGVAAVEFAVCLPVLLLILLGLWEVGRMTEVQQVTWNAAREGARDASMGQTSLLSMANNLVVYLQSSEPSAFGKGHTTTMKDPVVTLPANTYGYTCWDSTANKELFTVTFKDATDTTVTDPTKMSQLDRYEIGLQVPYASFSWLSSLKVTGASRLYATVQWASMVDSPFTLPKSLPAQ